MPSSRVLNLLRIRSIIGWVFLAHSALIALLFLVAPRAEGFPWLVLLISAVIVLGLTYVVVNPRRDEPMGCWGFGVAILILPGAVSIGFMIRASAASMMGNSVSGTLLDLLLFLWLPALAIALMARYILFKSLGSAAKHDQVSIARQRELDYERKVEQSRRAVAQPTSDGQMTGLEPQRLASVEIADTPLLFGSPGTGLTGSGFSFSAVAKGQAGEVNFAKALTVASLLPKFATFWSVHMPSEHVGADEVYSSDIDVVIATGSSLWLVDVKNYLQGDVVWKRESPRELVAIDRPTGGYIGKPRALGRNMELAQSRVRGKLEALGINRYRLRSAVVFMPTNRGIGEFHDVEWPGGVPAMGLPQFLNMLANEPPFDYTGVQAEYLVRVFKNLVKDESGSAFRPGDAPRPAPGSYHTSPEQDSPGTPPPARQMSAPATQSPSQPPATNPARATTPSGTGSAQPPAAAPAHCSECGSELKPEWTLCYTCGKDVE